MKGDKNPNFKWSFEKCKQEAQKYRCRHEFKTKNYNAYAASWKNKWLNDFFPEKTTR